VDSPPADQSHHEDGARRDGPVPLGPIVAEVLVEVLARREGNEGLGEETVIPGQTGFAFF
jgi:hypothetical protein